MITDITLAEMLRLRHHHRLCDALPQRGLHHQGGDKVAAVWSSDMSARFDEESTLHINTRKTLLHDEKSGNPLLM